jgi:prepilin-type N-terminal cleavage/methylation domain-containing protein
MSTYATNPQRRSDGGYTLIELIVSVAIFSGVMLIAASAFMTLISLDRQARATNDVVSNLSYVVDTMARSIRTGTDYSGGGSSFSFTNYDGQSITYLLKNDGTIGQCIGSCSASSAVSLTDPRIQITTFTFYVSGTTPGALPRGDGQQPRVLFTVAGTIRPSPTSQPISFAIESSATQRLIDL